MKLAHKTTCVPGVRFSKLKNGRRHKKAKRKKLASKKRLTYGAVAIAFILTCFLIYFSLNPACMHAVQKQ